MPEEKRPLDPYSYVANANLVLPQNRREAGPRRDKDAPAFEVESLYGKIDVAAMGSRVARDKVPYAVSGKGDKRMAGRAGSKSSVSSGVSSVDKLLKKNEFAGLLYRPKSAAAMAIYELLVGFVNTHFLPEVPQEILRAGTDDILAVMKDALKSEADKKAELQSMLALKAIDQDVYGQLVGLARKIVDYEDKEGTEDSTGLEAELAELVEHDDEDDADNEEPATEVVEEDEEGSDEEEIPTVVNLTEERVFEGTSVTSEKYWLDVRDVDAHWIQRQLSTYYKDSTECLSLSKQVFEVLEQSLAFESSGLSTSQDQVFRFLENHLGLLLDFDKFELIKNFIVNRKKIVFGMNLAMLKGDGDKYQEYLEQYVMRDKEGPEIVRWLRTAVGSEPEKRSILKPITPGTSVAAADLMQDSTLQIIDIESLGFSEGGHTMTNKKVELPPASWKKSHPGYEEIGIPAPQIPPLGPNERLVAISDLPSWSQPAFQGMRSLNRIQSALAGIALETHKNMLVCAPTGAGKTNVALLTILQTLGLYGLASHSLDLNAFKIVYIAPMKALVQEMVKTFTKRLSPFGITVSELSGDVQLNKAQLEGTQMIITTPEKWDVITRKHYGDTRSFTTNVKLVIIDEIHLLHDERGPVLESLVARILRSGSKDIRLVGLSATLPNFLDVASFLRVEESGLFHFDGRYRPCPLSQTYYGITEKKALKRLNLLNDLTYEKVVESVTLKNQMLVFVHSRKDTHKTALFLRENAILKETIHKFLFNPSARQLLEDTAEKVTSRELRELLGYGIGIHHAGLSRPDRNVVEELFAAGHLSVLISTSTLAWGVNLPAHTVLIKGTQVYSPEKGSWIELSPQDILQMFGRAGRPQFDQQGEGILLTSSTELQYYLSLCNMQLPIESQLLSGGKLVEALNAEIILGNVRTLDEAIDWCTYTYLYVRMTKNPELYQPHVDDEGNDAAVAEKLKILVHSAAVLLERSGLISYEHRSGRMQGTELGRITSHYYLSHQSIATYAKHLNSYTSTIDLFRIFAMSKEFQMVPVRAEEKAEVAKLLELVPIPVKEQSDDPLAKINVLLQTWISGLQFSGFAMMTDLVYVTQSAGRIFRAFLEIALINKWPMLLKKCMQVMLVITRKTWSCSNPLRQFRHLTMRSVSSTGASVVNVPMPVKQVLDRQVLKNLDKKEVPIERLALLEPAELGELYKVTGLNNARAIHRLVHAVPKLVVDVNIQPLNQKLLSVTLQVALPEGFVWDPFVHGPRLLFLIMIEDCNSESVLYYDYLTMRESYQGLVTRTFFVPLRTPLEPVYFIRVMSMDFLHSDTTVSVSFKNLVIPKVKSNVTELLDLTPIVFTETREYAALSEPSKQVLLETYAYHSAEWCTNPVQTQVWRSLFSSSDSLICTCPIKSNVELLLHLLVANMPKGSKVLMTASSPRALGEMEAFYASFGFKVKLLSGMDSGADIFSISNSLNTSSETVIFLGDADAIEKASRRKQFLSKIALFQLFVVLDIERMSSSLEISIIRMMQYKKTAADSRGETQFPRWLILGRAVESITDIAAWLSISQVFQFTDGHGKTDKKVSEALVKVPFYNPVECEFYCFQRLKDCIAASSDVTESNDGKILLIFSCKSILEQFTAGLDPPLMQSVSIALNNSSHDVNARFVLTFKDEFLAQTQVGCHVAKIVITSPYHYSCEAEEFIVDEPWMLKYFSELAPSFVLYAPSHMGPMLQQNVLNNPFLSLESSISADYPSNFLLPGISLFDLTNQQKIVELFTSTFYYTRLLSNPNFYGCRSSEDPVAISETLSELVEQAVDELSQAKMVSIIESSMEEENETIELTELGMIASHYGVSFETVRMFFLSLKASTKVKGLLELLASSIEFDKCIVRPEDLTILHKYYSLRLPFKLTSIQSPLDEPSHFNEPHIKAYVLLQLYLLRDPEFHHHFRDDIRFMVKSVYNLLGSIIDICSIQETFLTPVLAAFDLMQSMTHALHPSQKKQAFLKQLPQGLLTETFTSSSLFNECETIYDILNLSNDALFEAAGLISEEDQRVLGKQLEDFKSSFPNIELSVRTADSILSPDGDSIVTCQIRDSICVHFLLKRPYNERHFNRMDEEGSYQFNAATLPDYVMERGLPFEKLENWWVLAADHSSKRLLSVKRIPLTLVWTLEDTSEAMTDKTDIFVTSKVSLEVEIGEEIGKLGAEEDAESILDLTLYLITDSWLGADQEFPLKVRVMPSTTT